MWTQLLDPVKETPLKATERSCIKTIENVFNFSLSKGVATNSFKLATIIPVFKNDFNLMSTIIAQFLYCR